MSFKIDNNLRAPCFGGCGLDILSGTPDPCLCRAAVNRSSSQSFRNQSATYETLLIRTFLDVPDIDLIWHIGCCSITRKRLRSAKNLVPAPFESDLRRNDDLFSLSVLHQCSTDNFFGLSQSIRGRRIDEVYPVIRCNSNGSERFLFICSSPHRPSDRPGA